MDDATKITILKAMVSETDTEVLSAFLEIAKAGVLARLYPYDHTKTEVPDRNAMTQIKYAAYMIDKRGMDYQTIHIENGTHFHFGAIDMPADIASELVPYCGVIQ